MSDRNPEITELRLGKFRECFADCVRWDSDKEIIEERTEALTELATSLGQKLQDKELSKNKGMIWEYFDDMGYSDINNVYMDDKGLELTVFVDINKDKYVVTLVFDYSYQGVYAYF